MGSPRWGGVGGMTTVQPGAGQHLEVLRVMQPKVEPGVCGRLRAGEEYSAQAP